jgi:hypothetical protein
MRYRRRGAPPRPWLRQRPRRPRSRHGPAARVWAAALAALVLTGALTGCTRRAFEHGGRVLLDAHNAYPYHGQWRDRIDRALATGVPVAIEEDLAWVCLPPQSCRSVIAHEEPYTGDEPTLREYFFERIRPVVERALASANRREWPLIVLNLDFKTNEPEHHAAVWALLGEYEAWLTTAARTARSDEIARLDVRPVLVLTGEPDAQQAAFHDRVPVGGRLRIFGAVATSRAGETRGSAGAPPPDVSPGPRTNYRRWWNNPWSVVEAGGPGEAGEWTPEDAARLRLLVKRAHDAGLWIRFYTLNGTRPDEPALGWDPSYNFGSREAVGLRWRAALDAGVDFVATDQYEAFAAVRKTGAAR